MILYANPYYLVRTPKCNLKHYCNISCTFCQMYIRVSKHTFPSLLRMNKKYQNISCLGDNRFSKASAVKQKLSVCVWRLCASGSSDKHRQPPAAIVTVNAEALHTSSPSRAALTFLLSCLHNNRL